jgi:hypothetical protein
LVAQWAQRGILVQLACIFGWIISSVLRFNAMVFHPLTILCLHLINTRKATFMGKGVSWIARNRSAFLKYSLALRFFRPVEADVEDSDECNASEPACIRENRVRDVEFPQDAAIKETGATSGRETNGTVAAEITAAHAAQASLEGWGPSP